MQRVLLAHGGGGEEMHALINDLIFRIFDNEILRAQNDSAILMLDSLRTNKLGAQEVEISTQESFAFSTDSFVVSPIEFSGGNIGKLAVCGSVNDLAMVGANAQFLSCALILEEGLELEVLERILRTMKQEAQNAGVAIVCGDTKVLARGSVDKIFINTACVGGFFNTPLNTAHLKVGAKILLSGDIGRHGGVILAHREELALQSALKSDCACLKEVVRALIESDVRVQCMRDATRGGIASVLNEWADFKGYELLVREKDIAVCDEVAGICEILGFEPYELANEGTFLLAVDCDDAQRALEILQRFNPLASCIGEVVSDKAKGVICESVYGARRYLETPKGELLPRIC
ncbi:hydrogenase expression/formation protein HypE [Helicobacter himalayensis]|uniref:hydrogenase expression/formation protein HypE n=1 Tax=Helicobacter himalayensis TaxID=1591088 RepID=UPI003D6F16E1